MAVLTLLQSSGIYLIRNAVSGRVYVGAAAGFGARWRLHKRLLNAGRHHAIRLQRSWIKHGEECFSFEVIEVIDRHDFDDTATFREAMKAREQHWMDTHRAASRNYGFNSCPAAYSPLGIKHSEETKAKHRAGWTPERRKANSEKGKLQKLSPEHRAAFCLANKGKVRTPEQRAAVAAAKRGKTLSPEHRAKVAAAGIGRKHSTETRLKMSISAVARIAALPPEARRARIVHLHTAEARAKRGEKHSLFLKAQIAAMTDEERNALVARLNTEAATAKRRETIRARNAKDHHQQTCLL